jgi:hypothetical protein
MKNSRTTWVLITNAGKFGIDVSAWSSQEKAIDYAMTLIFGEDWEIQLYDDEWDEQSKLTRAYDAFTDGMPYRDGEKQTWEIHEVVVDEFAD